MSTKKIFYKKDYNDIMLFYHEEGQAVLMIITKVAK